MPSNLEYKIENLGSHHGQSDMELGLYMDGEIIGLVQYVLFDGELTVSDIIVRPEYRRQGFGSRMMKYIKNQHPEYKYVSSMKTDLGSKFVHKDIDINEVRRIVRDVLSENLFENESKFSDDYDFSKHSFTSGDCDIYAVSLHRLYGYPLFVVRGWFDDGMEKFDDVEDEGDFNYEDCHIVVKLPNGLYLDSEGEQGEQELRQNARFMNDVHKITIVPISEEEALNTFSCQDQEADIQNVMNYIKKRPTLSEENIDYKGPHVMYKDSSSSPLHNLLQSGQVAKDFYENIHHYAYLHNKSDQESVNIIKQARNKPDATVTIYRAVPKGVTEINSGDWISLSKSYAKHHGLHHEDPKLNMPVISKKVKVKDVWWDGNDVNEFSYFPGGLSEGRKATEINEIERREDWKKEITQVAKQLNIPLTNYLGDGIWGIAYEIPGNKVLKITTDDREIDNAKHLVGKKNKLLADIYKVYSIKGIKDKKVIVQEKLAPLTKEYVKALDIFGSYFNDFYNEEWTWGEMRFNGWEEDFDNVLKSAKYNGIPLTDIYSELLQILDEAGENGIDLTDMHEGNLGMKNGHLAAFDLS